MRHANKGSRFAVLRSFESNSSSSKRCVFRTLDLYDLFMDIQTLEQCMTENDSVHPPDGNATTKSSPEASQHDESKSAMAEIVESSPEECRQSLESISSTENLVPHDRIDTDDLNPGPPSIDLEPVKNYLSTVHEIEIKSEHVSSTLDDPTKYDLIYQNIEGLESRKIKSRWSTSCCEKMKLTAGYGKSKSNGNVKFTGGGRKVGKCAVGCAADCAAVCCCPCVVVHVLFLAVVKLPLMGARKLLSFAKKKTGSLKDKNDDVDSDDRSKKTRSYSMAWSSLRDSPVHSRGSSPVSQPVDPQKVWVEFYAAGHMGFAGRSLERD